MSPLTDLFKGMPVDAQHRTEVDKLIEELRRIGISDDFLSEHPGGLFNMQFKHIRAREIGKRLNELGGLELMQWAFDRMSRKLDKHDRNRLSEHLGYCWNNLNDWKY